MNTLPYIISSRVRLARNLRHYRFPYSASAEERHAVSEHVRRMVMTDACFRDAILISIDHLPFLERKILEEKHLISHLLATRGSERLVILPAAANASILVNEEDHVRIQVFSVGFAIKRLWNTAKRFEQHLQKELDFACSDQNKYITACPENAGSGLRVSAMMFVPGLIFLKQIIPLIQQCVSAGYTVRGTYGEGSLSAGYVVQVSNQRPHEQHEMSILKGFNRLCRSLMIYEKRARLAVLMKGGTAFRQRILSMTEQLLHSQKITIQTGTEILALYRLGVDLGLPLPYIPTGKLSKEERYRVFRQLDRLSIRIQPAHVRQYQQQESQRASSGINMFDDEQESIIRANLIRQTMMAWNRRKAEGGGIKR